MKKLLMIALSLTLAATLAVSGTIAYLTSEDGQVNVMTLGNVSIKQIEKERIAQDDTKLTEDNIQDFSQSLPLYPAVYDEVAWATDANGEQVYQAFPTGGSSALFNDDIKNVRDKMVFVENDGNTDAYVRTIFAFEAGNLKASDFQGDPNGLFHINWNADHWDWTDFSEDNAVTIDNVKYYYTVATYKGNAGANNDVHPDGKLPKDETTRPSLLQVFLNKKADNELCASFGTTYDIIALSQAVQAAGFADAKTALSEAFDKGAATVSKTDVAAWLDKLSPVNTVSTAEELIAALDAAANSDEETTIYLLPGTYTLYPDSDKHYKISSSYPAITITGPETAVIDGTFEVTGNATFKGVTLTNEHATTEGISKLTGNCIFTQGDGAIVTCENVTFDIKKATGITSWWSSGEEGTNVIVKNCTFKANGNRPMQIEDNATIEGCTFIDQYRYCVQLTASDAVINFKNNTIVDAGKTSGKPGYGLQLTSDYGNSNLTINGSGNQFTGTVPAENSLYVWEDGVGISNGFVDIATIKLNATDGELVQI